MADENAQGQNQPKPASPPPPPPAQQAKPSVDPKATATLKKQCFSDGYRDDEERGGKKNA